MKKSFLHVREKKSSCASIPLAVFIASVAIILLSAITVGTHIVNADPGEGTLALYPSIVSWKVGSEPVDKKFTLQMNVTGVTNIYGFPMISVHWNTSLFDLLDCTIDTTCIFGTPGAPKPAGTGDTYFKKGPIHEAHGNMSGTAYTEFAPLVPLNVTWPDWEKVLYLDFNYTGPDPAIGAPIDTYILIVDQFWTMPGGYKMGTKWAAYEAGTPKMKTFAVLGSCHFHYATEGVPPVADAADADGSEGSPITFDASGSIDNDGTIVLYEWDWNNDGSYDENTTSPTINHTWPDDYAGTVGLRVTDDDGLNDTDTASVTVQNVAPTVEAGPDQTVYVNQTVSVTGTFSDPGWNDTHTATIDWRDGTPLETATITITNPGGLGTLKTGTVEGSHNYTGAGVYTVTLNVTDDNGGVGLDTLNVTVSTVPVHDVAILSVTPNATEVVQGSAVNVTVVAYNEGTETETFNVTAYANTTEIGTQNVTNLGAGNQTTLTFIWGTTGLTPGEYIINVTAIVPVDDDPTNNFKTTTILIELPPIATYDFPVEEDGIVFHVVVETNSSVSVSNFAFSRDQKQISFDVTGPSGSVGFCNVIIPKTPKTLLGGVFTIFIDDDSIEFTPVDNATHASLYFTYELLSTRNVKIRGTEVIPEFPTLLPVLIMLLILAVSTIILKRRTQKHPLKRRLRQ